MLQLQAGDIAICGHPVLAHEVTAHHAHGGPPHHDPGQYGYALTAQEYADPAHEFCPRQVT